MWSPVRLFGIVVLVGLSAAPALGNDGLAPATQIPLASPPAALTSEDLNGDTRDDIVASLPASGEVAVLLSNGDGTLQPPRNEFAGETPTGITVGRVDLNSTSYDVVTADQDMDEVSVLYGNGDGTFDGQMSYGYVTAPNSVAVGSIDTDGHRDIIAAGDDGVSVLWSSHDYPFEAQSDRSTPAPARAVHIADLNSDYFNDIVVAMPGAQAVAVLWGNGTQTLAAPQSYPVGGTPSDLELGDFNGDMKLDLVVARSDDIAVLLGDGSGGFGPPIASATGGRPGGFAFAPYTPLSLYVTLPDTDSVSVLRGNGDGSFASPETWPASPGSADAVNVQLDMSHGRDLVLANSRASSVSVMLNGDPRLSFDPSSGGLSFGQVTIGSTVAPRPMTVVNSGNAMMRVAKLSTIDLAAFTRVDGPPPEFPVVADGCTGVVLLPAQTCALAFGVNTAALGNFRRSVEVATVPTAARSFPISAQVVAPPMPPDTTPPALTTKAAARQRALAKRTIVVNAACNEVCQLTANGRFWIGKKRTRLHTATSRATNVGANHAVSLKVVFSKRTAKTLRKALASKKKVVAKVTVTANDGHNLARRTLSIRIVG